MKFSIVDKGNFVTGVERDGRLVAAFGNKSSNVWRQIFTEELDRGGKPVTVTDNTARKTLPIVVDTWESVGKLRELARFSDREDAKAFIAANYHDRAMVVYDDRVKHPVMTYWMNVPSSYQGVNIPEYGIDFYPVDTPFDTSAQENAERILFYEMDDYPENQPSFLP